LREIVEVAKELYKALEILKKRGFDADIALVRGNQEEYIVLKVKGAEMAERLFHEASRRGALRNLGYFQVLELSEDSTSDELWSSSKGIGEI